ncbi:carboxymuconolactone decarboxylase family protein [Methylocapsa polymorpha]|uniref:Alkyl hydroperoxide reductase AhpD n=1 Tax=Methylocapsa polymorpha TaxID=3080828 RepID=A0ABZ0HXL0_9HYPH|nr:carboxymuconolactone decarboxylase family protein [Methylocapsa sp. RX1]
MSIESLKDRIPDFARDVRLNLSALVNDDALGEEAKYGLLLACAIATRNADVAQAFDREAASRLSPAARDAARAAAAIMAMNNVYYRFTHLASNKAYRTMPAKLRMSVIGSPGVAKVDFELWCLAVSAINGCGACVDAHEKVLAAAGVTSETIQFAARCAAIVQSVAVALEAARLPVAVA